MSATIISYPVAQEDQLPDRERLLQRIEERDKLEHRIREMLNSSSIDRPKHSCAISQIHYTDFAVAIGWSDDQFQGYNVRRETGPFLPRFVAVHSVSKVQRVFVLPDPMRPDFLAQQMERTAARNLTYLKEGKIPEEYRIEASWRSKSNWTSSIRRQRVGKGQSSGNFISGAKGCSMRKRGQAPNECVMLALRLIDEHAKKLEAAVLEIYSRAEEKP